MILGGVSMPYYQHNVVRNVIKQNQITNGVSQSH